MSVYVDSADIRADVPNGSRTVRGIWCHMTADTRLELDLMADRIGLRRSWIQHPGTWKEHYDLTQSKKRLALAAGAVEVDSRQHELKVLGPRRRAMQAAHAEAGAAHPPGTGPTTGARDDVEAPR